MRDGHMAQYEPYIQNFKKKKKDKKKKKGKSKGKRKEEGRRTESEQRERKKKEKKKVFRFSLRSTEIELSVFIEVRRKVDLRIASYAWVPKSWSFVKNSTRYGISYLEYF